MYPVLAKCHVNVEPDCYSGAVGQMSKSVVTPGASNSNGSFTDWFDHKCVAALNKWKDDNKILWLQVQLMGKAQTAFKQLLVVVRERGHDGLVTGLHQCFEPDMWPNFTHS